MNKKFRNNRYPPERVKKSPAETESLTIAVASYCCLKCILIVVSITVLSLGLIFIYDFITQTDFLNIKTIEISGTKHTSEDALLKLADIDGSKNIFQMNLSTAKKRIVSHPWVKSVDIKRSLSLKLIVSITEERPLAIVKIANLSDILINTDGNPFKEYNPQKDNIKDVPVVTGVTLKKSNHGYTFNSDLFNCVMAFFKTVNLNNTKRIRADKTSGISIETNDIYNNNALDTQKTVKINLGFSQFKAKLNKAVKISEYIDKNFPERTIRTIDLFNIEKVFIKTKLNDALHGNLTKGV